MIFCVVFLDFLQLVKVERYGGFGGRLYDFMFDCVDYHTCKGVPETPLHRVGATYRDLDSHVSFFMCERIGRIKVFLHVRSPPPCPLKVTIRFTIISMVTDTLMGKMSCTPILSIKVAIKKKSKVSLTNTVTLTVRVNKT